jgi:3-oxoacyl-(acyl-carrier-protein) synthase
MHRSYVLTAAGLISAAGDNPQDLFTAVCSGMVLASPLSSALPEIAAAAAGASEPAPDFPVAPIRRFDPAYYIKRKGLPGLSRASLLAITAASRIAERIATVPAWEVGIAYGSAWGSLETIVALERSAWRDTPRMVDPLLFTEAVASVAVGQMAAFFGWSAWGATLSAGSASGLEALRLAMGRIDEERASAAVVGGGDALNLPILRALWAQEVTADGAGSLPYAAERSGPVGGEAACRLVVEPEESARERGVIPLARIEAEAGCYAGAEPAVGLATRLAIVSLVEEALEQAMLTPAEIDLLVLPGNGSVDADREQALAVVEVFGSGAAAPPAVAPKAVTGETWAAGGPIGVVIALEAIRTGRVPGRPRTFVADPGLSGLNLPRESYDRAVRHALVLDASWGGHLTAVVLSAWSGSGR